MSSFKLFEIPQAIDDAIENFVDPETGEMLTEEETMAICEALEGERDHKIEYLCKLVKNYNAEVEALKEQKRQFDKRIKQGEGRIERIKDFIKYVLQGEKWKANDASVGVSYRTTKECVKVLDVASVPDRYFKTPHTESNMNKTELKTDLLIGTNIPGVELENRTSVIIK